MINVVTFPGLGLEFTLDRVAFHLFGRPIFWYGIIIASGMLLAVYLCSRWAPRFGIVPDHILDLMFFAVPAALVAVRAYYVIFNLDLYRRGDGSLDWGAILRYSDGGLAIYGAIISSVIVLLIFCKVRKVPGLRRPGSARPVHRPAHRPVGQFYECGSLWQYHHAALADVRNFHRRVPAPVRLCGSGRV